MRHGWTQAYTRYNQAPNEYTPERRTAEKNFEKDITEECTDQSKLFFNYKKI